MINPLSVKESIEYKMLKDIHAKSLEVFEKTSKNFGDGFFTTWDKMGDNAILSAYPKIADKFNTFEHFALVLRHQPDSDNVIRDSIENLLIDLANYCLMTAVAIKKSSMDDNKNINVPTIPAAVINPTPEQSGTYSEVPQQNSVPSFLQNRNEQKIMVDNRNESQIPRRNINQNQVF